MTSLIAGREIAEKDPFLASFDPFTNREAAAAPSWLLPFRKAGLSRFAEIGFPSTADEDWRFTNVAPIAKLSFSPSSPSPVGDWIDSISGVQPFAALAEHRLVFVDGYFVPALSRMGALPPGVVVKSLAGAMGDPSLGLERRLGGLALDPANAFAALNSAYFTDGGLVLIPPGTELESPIHLSFVTTSGKPGMAMNVRSLIHIGERASATVVESFIGLKPARSLTTCVSEVSVDNNGKFEHIRFQDETLESYHVGTLHYQLGKQTRCTSHSFSLGARLFRSNITASLVGEGLECVLNGLYLTRADQLADHHMVVDHARPHCASHEYFNGILDDRSKGVFHGRILVRPEAQKTDAKQTNKNLLLSDDATVDTKPQLEIYADDVKCTHGATTGHMDEDAIFYLRSRGIGLERARRMLVHAFAGEIIGRVQHEALRDELDQIIRSRLALNPHVKVEG